jgi:hypothetical protein
MFVACLFRGVPLLFCAAPKTPLRILAIVAVDTLHVLRYARLLPRTRIRELAWLIDFQGCANAAWDGKRLSDVDYAAFQQRLVDAGLGVCIDEYLRLLRELETGRPAIGGDHRRFEEVRSYREAVARLAVSTVVAVGLNAECSAEHIRATRCDDDVEMLFRILMQCQIIDDVIDYQQDLSAGLPSFLTASASLSQSIALTAQSVSSYAANVPPRDPQPTTRDPRPATRDRLSPTVVFPVRMALSAFTAITRLVVRIAQLRFAHRHLTWSSPTMRTPEGATASFRKTKN